MIELADLIEFCDKATNSKAVKDFPGANNGLQIENNGSVKKIGAAVDAGFTPFQKAIDEGVDFLIVHHGLFWNPIDSITGKHYKKLKLAIENNLAVYSCHLPLDAHPVIGNNRLLADAVGLEVLDWFVEFEGTPIALLASSLGSRQALRNKLESTFPTVTAIEFGSEKPERVAVLTGSGRSALKEMRSVNADTLITGELRQEHFNLAQEEGFNLYVCGHYDTETFGVKALAEKAASHFGLESCFLSTGCPL